MKIHRWVLLVLLSVQGAWAANVDESILPSNGTHIISVPAPFAAADEWVGPLTVIETHLVNDADSVEDVASLAFKDPKTGKLYRMVYRNAEPFQSAQVLKFRTGESIDVIVSKEACINHEYCTLLKRHQRVEELVPYAIDSIEER